MMMSEIVRFHALVHGYVQGVSFRYYAFRQAASLALTGYVRNCEDGGVEVVAEGPREAADKLLAWLHVGPPSAEVGHVDVEWQRPLRKFTKFEVRI
jgi:acylphosphatase